MVSFVTLHRGPSLATAELVAVSTDPDVITHVAGALLRDRDRDQDVPDDRALVALRDGRRRALRVVRREATTK